MDGWAHNQSDVPARCRASSSRALHAPSDSHIGTPGGVPACTLYRTTHGPEELRSTEAIVFLVDDDSDMLKAIAHTVASAGWPIHIYLSGEAFLRAYDPGQAGCVVFDLRMPYVNGCGRASAQPAIRRPHTR
jgi:hypothetical protein